MNLYPSSSTPFSPITFPISTFVLSFAFSFPFSFLLSYLFHMCPHFHHYSLHSPLLVQLIQLAGPPLPPSRVVIYEDVRLFQSIFRPHWFFFLCPVPAFHSYSIHDPSSDLPINSQRHRDYQLLLSSISILLDSPKPFSDVYSLFSLYFFSPFFPFSPGSLLSSPYFN